MKKLCIMMLLFLNSFVFGNMNYKFDTQTKNEYYQKSMLVKPESHKFTSEDVIDLVENMVPDPYINAFLHYSTLNSRYKTDTFRLYLLALGYRESEWVSTRSHKVNDNGTYDWGYLMLNDHNIRNSYFMTTYGPTIDFIPHDLMGLYLVVCINYFKDLYLRFGCDALYVYNAGEYNYVYNRLPDSTYIYKFKIKITTDRLVDSLYSLAIKNMKARERRIIEERDEKLRKEAEFREFRRRWILSDIIHNRLTGTNYFDIASNNRKYQELIYDPRKKFLKTINFHTFYIPCLINDMEIENALNMV
jgi:hypothetical protein